MSGFVLDASLALQWFLEDEANRKYSLEILASLSESRAIVPTLWFYEVGNGLVMAYRRKRISREQIEQFLERLRILPIDVAESTPIDHFELPILALRYDLTNYDATYLQLAMKLGLPLATTDRILQKAAASAGVNLVTQS